MWSLFLSLIGFDTMSSAEGTDSYGGNANSKR
jgi:hypothetical protein